MTKEFAYYETYPKVHPVGRPSHVTIRPLGKHAAFDPERTYVVQILPMEEQLHPYQGENDMNYPHFEYRSCDGAIHFDWTFEEEEEYLIRVFLPPELNKHKSVTTQRVYAVQEDLYALRPYMADFHIHTTYSDGKEAPAYVAASYRKKGFDIIAITDHRTMEGSLEAIEAYKDAPIDLMLYRGEEIHLDHEFEKPYEQDTHNINIGGRGSVNTLARADKAAYYAQMKDYMEKHPQPAGVDAAAVASTHWIYEKTRELGGMSIFCHPHWKENVYHVSQKLLDRLFELQEFDVFELLGGQEVDENNCQTAYYVEKRAEGKQVPIVGSSDSHGTIEREYFNWFKTIVFAKSKAFEDVKDAITGLYSVAVEEYRGESPRVHGPYRLVKYALFLLKAWFPVHDELCAEEGRQMFGYINGDETAGRLLAMMQGRTERLLDKYLGKAD